MKREMGRQIRCDCMKYMKTVTVARFWADLAAVTVPTIAATMLGGMTDALIALDMTAILRMLPQFLAAMALSILAVPLFTMWEYSSMSSRSYEYDIYLVNRFLHKPLREIEQRDLGEVMERLEGSLGDFCWNTVLTVSLPLTIICYAAVTITVLLQSESLFWFSLSLVFFPALPVLKAQKMGKKKGVYQREEAEFDEKRRGAEADIVPSRDFLQGYHLEGLEISMLRKLYQNHMEQSGKKKLLFDATEVSLDFLIRYSVPLCVVAIGAALVSLGRMTVGTLLSGYLMLPAIEKCYTYGAKLIEQRKAAPEYISRIAMFYGVQEETGKDSDSGTEEEALKAVNGISLENVTFTYDESRPAAVKNFSMKLKGSGCIRLDGPNGCGKSTLIFLLAGLYSPVSGRIADEKGEQLSLHQLRENVSLQEQNGALFTGTIQENLFIPPEKAGQAKQLLLDFGLLKPLSYHVEPDGANLSPGEQKKVLLIRALLKQACFYVFDEPLNHLDSTGKRALEERVTELMKHREVLIVSHQEMEEVEETQVVTMDPF